MTPLVGRCCPTDPRRRAGRISQKCGPALTRGLRGWDDDGDAPACGGVAVVMVPRGAYGVGLPPLTLRVSPTT